MISHEIATALTTIQTELAEHGLWRTYHKVDEVKATLGWEMADKLSKEEETKLKYLVKFTYEGTQYSCEVPCDEEDNWWGLDVNDELAFEINIFSLEEGEPWQVNVLKLEYKTEDGVWTLDGNLPVIFDNETVDYFERV